MMTELQMLLVHQIAALIRVSRAAGESAEEMAARIVQVFLEALAPFRNIDEQGRRVPDDALAIEKVNGEWPPELVEHVGATINDWFLELADFGLTHDQAVMVTRAVLDALREGAG